MPTTRTLYAAIRTTEGREWIDWKTLGLFPGCARIAAEQCELSLGKQSLWAKDNPIARISKIQLTETE